MVTRYTVVQDGRVYEPGDDVPDMGSITALESKGNYRQYNALSEDIDKLLSQCKMEKNSMNKVIMMGRLTRDPEIRYSQNGDQMCIARYTLAVDRKFKKQGDGQTADFINCIAFGKSAEFAEKYLKQGTKIAITGRIQTGSYTNKDGNKVYTTDVVVEEQEFCESKNANNSNSQQSNTANASNQPSSGNDFMSIPEGIEDDLPFK